MNKKINFLFLNINLFNYFKAKEMYKRLLHPFSTKNEEVKREVKEVYEEKCENVVPTKRFIFIKIKIPEC